MERSSAMRRWIVPAVIALSLCSPRSDADFCDYTCYWDLQWRCDEGELVKRPDFDTPRFDVLDTGSPGTAAPDLYWAHTLWRNTCEGNTSALPYCSVVWNSGVALTPDPNDGYNTVAWIDSEWLWEDLYSDHVYYEVALAFTQPNFYEDSCELADTDTRFNGWEYQWGEGSPPNTGDIRTWMLHEAGHQLGLEVSEDLFCADCVMYFNVGLGGPDDRDILDGDRHAYCRLYGSTSVGDLYSFTATPSDGRVLLEWSVIPASGPHDFRLYASEDGAPFVFIHAEASGVYEEHFSWWDEDVRNGHEYRYAIWCDDGYGPTPSCTPSGAAQALAEYDQIAVSEEEGGIRVSWTTSQEAGALSGFDVYASSSGGYIDDLVKLNGSLIAAQGQMTEYDCFDSDASHGWPRHYLLMAVASATQERCGPVDNPCCRPYPANCELAFAGTAPTCALLCPAGDAQQQGGAAPIELEVTIRDSCGYPIEGYEDILMELEPMGDGANFQLCCFTIYPELLGPLAVRPTDPTDADGQTSVGLYWGGGAAETLRVSAVVGTRETLPDVLSIPVRSPDISGDCLVGLADWSLLSLHYLTDYWPADLNCNGTVGLGDVGLLSVHYTHECGSSRTRPVPPELLAHLGEDIAPDAQHAELSLEPNTPNPFRRTTEIAYTVPVPGSQVRLTMYDLTGRRVRTLIDGRASPGRHAIVWDGTDEDGVRVASGTYFCRMEAPGFLERRKIVLIK
jgi:hypothetical protein